MSELIELATSSPWALLATAAVVLVAGLTAAGLLLGFLVRHVAVGCVLAVTMLLALAPPVHVGPLVVPSRWVALAWVSLVATLWLLWRIDHPGHARRGWWLSWTARHWAVSLLATFSAVSLGLAGPAGLLSCWATVALTALGLWWGLSGWWDRWVVPRVRSTWREATIYWPHWEATFSNLRELTARATDDEALTATTSTLVPRRLAVDSGPWTDRVLVRLLDGSPAALDRWHKATESLRASFGADECRVEPVDPRSHAVRLVFRRGDPLAEIVPSPDPVPVTELDLTAVPVGRTEWGTPWTLPLLGGHPLVAGLTGSGKGSVTGSLLTSLAPAIGDGLVEVPGVDPKGGVELGLVEDLFVRLAHEPDDMVDLLESEAAAMAHRLTHVKAAHRRRYEWSLDQPHRLVVVDELAWLVAYQQRRLRERAETALLTLLSQGRAAGWTILGLVQDPRKETIPFRDLFTHRVALRLSEPGVIDAVLGDGAYLRGARADEIRAPGVGYVVTESDPTPQRVRAGWTPDEHLQAIASEFPAPRRAAHAVIDIEPTSETVHRPAPVTFDDDAADDLAAWA